MLANRSDRAHPQNTLQNHRFAARSDGSCSTYKRSIYHHERSIMETIPAIGTVEVRIFLLSAQIVLDKF
jgi:hypothetical protein